MKCPVCGSEVKKPCLRLTLDKCEQCGGIWFASGEFEFYAVYSSGMRRYSFDAVAAEIKVRRQIPKICRFVRL